MKRKLAVLILVTQVLVGCSRKAALKEAYYDKAAAPMARRNVMLLSSVAFANSSGRYIAEQDKLDILAPEAGLQKSWEAAAAYCRSIRCEVVSSSITTRTANSVPAGSIAMRVVPDDLGKLLAQLEKFGRIAQHTTEREDKTTAVVDTEAKIKNLTAFRDNLRNMLAKPSAKVSDLVEIQKQLADTQSELDSETAQREILANETEKVAVEVNFRVEATNGARSGFFQIWKAVRESGYVLGDSTASLITTVVAVIPWLVIIVPGFWLLRRTWLRFKSRRKQSQPA